jgi:hypothetical protein
VRIISEQGRDENSVRLIYYLLVRKTRRVRKPRLPLEALRRIGSRPVTTKKGAKGYDRELKKEEARKAVEEEADGGGA